MQQATLRIVEFYDQQSTQPAPLACKSLQLFMCKSHSRGIHSTLQVRYAGLTHIKNLCKYSFRNILILLFKGQSVGCYCLLFYLPIRDEKNADVQ